MKFEFILIRIENWINFKILANNKFKILKIYLYALFFKIRISL